MLHWVNRKPDAVPARTSQGGPASFHPRFPCCRQRDKHAALRGRQPCPRGALGSAEKTASIAPEAAGKKHLFNKPIARSAFGKKEGETRLWVQRTRKKKLRKKKKKKDSLGPLFSLLQRVGGGGQGVPQRLNPRNRLSRSRSAATPQSTVFDPRAGPSPHKAQRAY